MASEAGPLPLRWVHAPRQDRSKKTLERLLDATEAIIRERGVDAVTIPEVVQAAKSSVGSFYGRFPNKTALLSCLHERACEQSVATIDIALDPDRWRDVPTADLVRSFVRFAVLLFHERQPMMLAFNAAIGADPGFADRRARTAAAIGLRVRALLADRRGDLHHPRPDRAVEMALRALTATLEQRNALEASGVDAVKIDDEALIEELSRMMLAYLGVRPA
jgi:AcrR family transcriptional regulator